MFSEKYIKAIYFIDLSGGEVVRDGFGRDIDLIIEVKSSDLDKYELETTIEAVMYKILNSLEELKCLITDIPRMIEVHIIRSGIRLLFTAN